MTPFFFFFLPERKGQNNNAFQTRRRPPAAPVPHGFIIELEESRRGPRSLFIKTRSSGHEPEDNHQIMAGI